MLKASCLTLLYILGLFSEVQSQVCSSKITLDAYFEENKRTYHITPGYTQRLDINCTVNATRTNGWESIKSITLYLSRNKMDYRLIISINETRDRFYLDPNDYRSYAYGSISVTEESFLFLLLQLPQYDDEGIYRCDVQGVLKSGKKQNCTAYNEIYSDQIRQESDCITAIDIEALPARTNFKDKYIQPGITKTLKVSCSIGASVSKKWKSVDSLYLYHSLSRTSITGDTVAGVVRGAYEERKIGTGKGLSSVSKRGETYLSVEWPLPDLEHAGYYICMSEGKSKSDMFQHCDVRADILAAQTCNKVFQIRTFLYDDFNYFYAVYLRPGFTFTLEVVCSLNIFTTLDLDRIQTITLLHAEVDSSKYKTIVSISKTSYVPFKIPDGEGKASGVISNKIDSYLKVRWDYPDYNKAGSYKCEAIGESMTGTPQNCSVSARIPLGTKLHCTSLRIEALPNKDKVQSLNSDLIYIEPGSTKSLRINCSINVKKTFFQALNKLKLLRADVNSLVYHVVAYIGLYDKNITILDGEGRGIADITENGESNLYVEWAYPFYQTAGKYICEAYGIAKTGKPDFCSSSSVKVALSEDSSKLVMKQLQTVFLNQIKLLDENKKLHETVTILKGKVNDLKDEIASGKKKEKTNAIKVSKALSDTWHKLFKIPAKLYNRQYFWPKSSTLVYPEMAQKSCAEYGAYLAEINDEEEYIVFVTLLKTNDEFHTRFLISGSDQIAEGKFLYAKDNEPSKFVAWKQGEPNGEKKQNCLYFHYVSESEGWKMYDDECFLLSTPDQMYKYICEQEII